MRLIDADALVEAIKDYPYGFRGMIVCDIAKQPTIDAVPVVRCKDCKHSEHWYRDKRRCFLWHEVGIGVFEDGFCSYGERSEE